MFDQFIIMHFTGLILWKNKDTFDRDVIDKLISQILIENRQVVQGVEIGNQRYFHLVFRDIKLFFIASYPKVTSYLAAEEIMRGLARSFLNNYESAARSVEVDLDLQTFEKFSNIYQADIGSLVTTGRLTSSVAKDSPKVEEKQQNEILVSNAEENAEPATSQIQQITISSSESVQERMQMLKQQMRANAAKKTQEIQSQLRANKESQNSINKSTQKQKQAKDAENEEELQYSVSHGNAASQIGLSAVQNGIEASNVTASPSKQSNSKWFGFFGKSETEDTAQSFWGSWKSTDGNDKLKLRLKQKLLDSNVSIEAAQALLEPQDQTGNGIFSEDLGSGFTARREVRKRLKQAIERILVSGNVSIVQAAQERRRQRQAGEAARPYVLAVVGVNGMGKTTTVAKLVYKFQQEGLRVFCCACDSYRSGAVEQLTEHCRRLNCGLFEQGYGRSGAAVARHGIAKATQENYDVVLLDTAGRMHNNGALMQELAGLVRENEPDAVLFVAEALVGSSGTEQLRDFNSVLNAQAGRGIDGIILTKFDAVGGRVGAALNLCYASGLPIAFLGVGQGYTDIVEVDTQEIVEALV